MKLRASSKLKLELELKDLNNSWKYSTAILLISSYSVKMNPWASRNSEIKFLLLLCDALAWKNFVFLSPSLIQSDPDRCLNKSSSRSNHSSSSFDMQFYCSIALWVWVPALIFWSFVFSSFTLFWTFPNLEAFHLLRFALHSFRIERRDPSLVAFVQLDSTTWLNSVLRSHMGSKRNSLLLPFEVLFGALQEEVNDPMNWQIYGEL